MIGGRVTLFEPLRQTTVGHVDFNTHPHFRNVHQSESALGSMNGSTSFNSHNHLLGECLQFSQKGKARRVTRAAHGVPVSVNLAEIPVAGILSQLVTLLLPPSRRLGWANGI